MKTTHLYIFFLILCLVGCNRQKPISEEEQAQVIKEIHYEYGIAVDSFRIESGRVQSGQTLSGILAQRGAAAERIRELALIPRDTFDVRTIGQGKEYLCFYTPDSTLEYFVYKQSRIQSVVFHLKDSMHVERQLKQIQTLRKTADATIETSLWNAFVGQGISPTLAIELSEVYQWTVDFFGG